jgi:hypothetical protein
VRERPRGPRRLLGVSGFWGLVGATSAAMLWFEFVVLERQSVSSSYGGRVTFLLCGVAKRKVTKREGHPAWRLPGIHARQVREVGFSTGLLS